MAEILPPFEVDKELRIKWSVPCRLVPHPFEEMCRSILQGKEDKREDKEASSDEEDNFFGNLVCKRSDRSGEYEEDKAMNNSKNDTDSKGGLEQDDEGSGMQGTKPTRDEYLLPINYVKCIDGDHCYDHSVDSQLGDCDRGEGADGSTVDQKPPTDEEIEETMRDVRRIRLGLDKPRVLDLGFSRLRHVTDVSAEYMCGPTPPNVRRLLDLTGKTKKEVGEALGLSDREWDEIQEGRNDSFNLWTPVMARVAMWTSRPLVRLLRREDPAERLGWGTQGADRVWRISTLPTIGETSRRGLEICQKLETSKRVLQKGWYQWEDRSLTEEETEAFFAGESEIAERMGRILLQLSDATDSKLLFRMFMEF